MRIATGRFDTMPMAERAVSRLREASCSEHDIDVFFDAPPGQHRGRRPSGVMVAVHLDGGPTEPQVLRILRESGADPVRAVEGEWRDGKWRDSNPVSAPQPASGGEQVVYRLFPGGYGKWNVFEGDMGRLLSEFPGRQEALDYATSLAMTKANAVVEIYRAGGVLESSRAYSRSPANPDFTPG